MESVSAADSCDTFVVLPPASGSKVIFGKNSDRTKGEVQEVVYSPPSDHGSGKKLQVQTLDEFGTTVLCFG